MSADDFVHLAAGGRTSISRVRRLVWPLFVELIFAGLHCFHRTMLNPGTQTSVCLKITTQTKPDCKSGDETLDNLKLHLVLTLRQEATRKLKTKSLHDIT